MPLRNVDIYKLDSNQLFREHSVDEIVELSQKLQVEIDKKRQEIREMVGERYRDVISTTDTVQAMGDALSKALDKYKYLLNGFQNLDVEICKNFEINHAIKKTTDPDVMVAVQVKVLSMIPELIWERLDSKDYLQAAQLYLLGQHISTGLTLSYGERLPIVLKISSKVSRFRQRILSGAKKYIQSAVLEAEVTTNNLCSILLLEGIGVPQLISMFLDLRRSSLGVIVDKELLADSSVKEQISNVAHCVRCTVEILRSCFGAGRVSEVLRAVCQSPTVRLVEFDKNDNVQDHLPDHIKSFRPTIVVDDCPASELSSAEDRWLAAAAGVADDGVVRLLKCVVSGRALGSLRASLASEAAGPAWQKLLRPRIGERARDLVTVLFDGLWMEWRQRVAALDHSAELEPPLGPGHSQQLEQLCAWFDGRLKEARLDLRAYLDSADDERAELEDHLRANSRRNIECIAQELQSNHSGPAESVCCARVLRAVSQSCPQLQQTAGPELWLKMKNLLLSTADTCWRLWLETEKERCLVDVEKKLVFPLRLAKWATVSINEETDEEQVNSVIRLPQCPSVGLACFLHETATRLSRIGLHTLPRPIHQSYINQIVKGVLGRFESMLEEKDQLQQTEALQMFFDVKYIGLVCVPRDDKEDAARIRTLGEKLADFIDPFDLNVFYPHLQKFVKQSVLCTQGLVGTLLPVQTQLAHLGQPERLQSEPSILAVNSSAADAYFPMLPITTPQVRTFGPKYTN